jgi:hydrogenase maturation protein HypF
VEPDLVVCDLHPQYRSSAYAAEQEARGVPVLRVQHHEAHAAACMAENGFAGEGIALALDGLGYGTDGTIWGGELLAGRPGRFERVGHLVPVAQPGGDRAAVEPWRMAASHLRRLMGSHWMSLPLPAFTDRDARERQTLDAMITRGLQSPLTSSCGRLFDAAAAVLGFRGRLLYSAQAAMELEALAATCREPAEPYPCVEAPCEGPILLDPAPLLRALLDDVLAGRDRGACALAFHRGLARLFALGAAEASRRTGLSDVFLSGGCVQNALFTGGLAEVLRSLGLRPHLQRQIPPNDGGVCFGQAAWALGSLAPTWPGPATVT